MNSSFLQQLSQNVCCFDGESKSGTTQAELKGLSALEMSQESALLNRKEIYENSTESEDTRCISIPLS